MAAVIGALRAVLSLESAGFMAGLTSAEKALRGFDKRMKGIGGGLQRVGAAVSVAGAGIAAAMRQQLNYADEMGQAAQKFGIPVEALSRLNYAADLSDVSMETLAASLKKLSVGMAGSGSAFDAVGIAVRDADGKLRPAQAVLEDVADLFATMPDGADKTALAVRLLGKSGADMIPMLNGGGDALRALGDEADAMGLVITNETAVAANEFNDNLDRLWKTLTGITTQMMAALAPAMKTISDKAVELAKWFQNLSPETQKWAGAIGLVTIAAGPLLVGLGLLISSLGSVLAVLKLVAAFFVTNPIMLGVLAVAGAAYLIYSNWEPIKKFFSELWDRVKAAADAAATWTVEKWTAAASFFNELLAQLRGFFAAFWEAIKGRPVDAFKFYISTWANIGVEFGRLLEPLLDVFNSLWERVKAVAAKWVDDFMAIGGQIVDGLKRGIEEKWDALVKWFNDSIDGMTAGVKDLLGIQSPSKVFRSIGLNVTQGLANGLEGGTGAVANAMAGVTEAVSGASGSLSAALQDVNDWGRDTFAGLLKGTTTLGKALDNLRDRLIDTFANNAWDYLWSALFGGAGGGGGLLSGIFNADGNAFQSGRIKAFANGGIVTGPMAFPMRGGVGLMGEAGAEAIMPLKRGADGKLGVVAQGGGGSVVVNQTINVSAGVAQTVRAEMLGLLPQFKNEAIRGVIEANRRGGSAMRGLA